MRCSTRKIRQPKPGRKRREQPTDRCRTCRTDAVRIVRVPNPDPDADRLQRRILSRSAEREAREIEARLLAMADEIAAKQGLNRRRFFQSAAGMAASFVAMNEVYGPLFDVA